MTSVLFRRRRLILVLLVFVAIFVLLSVKSPISRWARKPVMTVVTPLLRGVEAVGRWAGRVGEAIAGCGATRERDRLERQVSELQAELAALEAELESARATAAQLDELREFNLTLLPARIVGRDPTSWYNTAVLNVGSGRGVRRGMQVVRGRWYVGRVEEVGPGWSRVMLALDPRSVIPATVAGQDIRGLVETTRKRTLLFKYLADEPEVRPGDRIVTARATTTGNVAEMYFVEGFEVGTLTALAGEESGWQTAVLERPAMLDRLSEVLVVISE